MSRASDALGAGQQAATPRPLHTLGRASRAARRLQAPLGLLACWVGLEVAFTAVAGHEGLLVPFGPVNLWALALGLALLGLRLVGSFLLMPWFAWRLSAGDRAGAAAPGQRR